MSLDCLRGPSGSCGVAPPSSGPPRASFVGHVASTLSPHTDTDVFSFEGTAGTVLRLNVRGTTNGLDPIALVHDPDGTRLINGSADGAACDAAYNGTCSFSAGFVPSLSGVHSLAVSDWGINSIGDD